MNNERDKVKYSINCIFITFLVSIFLQFALGVLLSVAGLNRYLSCEGPISFLLSDILIILTMVFPFLILANRMSILNDIKNLKKKVNTQTQMYLFFIGGLVSFWSNIFASVITVLIENLNIQFDTVKVPDSKSLLETVITFISVAVFPAIVEEFIFRGVVLNIVKKYNVVASILISAFAFSLTHGNIPQILFTFPVGIYYGLVYIKTGSIRLPIMMHLFNNAIVVLESVVKNSVANEIYYVIFSYLINIFVLVLGLVGVLKLVKADVFSIKQEKSLNISSLGECFSAFCTSAPTIIYYVCMLVFILMSIKST